MQEGQTNIDNAWVIYLPATIAIYVVYIIRVKSRASGVRQLVF